MLQQKVDICNALLNAYLHCDSPRFFIPFNAKKKLVVAVASISQVSMLTLSVVGVNLPEGLEIIYLNG